MYGFLLWLHSALRWLVLLSAVYALFTAYSGLFGKRDFGPRDKVAGVSFTSLFGLQVVLGLILYFIGPWGIRGFSMLDAAEGSARVQLIFFGMYHITLMLVGLIVAQLGYSRAKRASSRKSAFRTAAIGYTVSLLLVLLAIPWGIRPNFRPLSSNSPSEQHLALTTNRSSTLFNVETNRL